MHKPERLSVLISSPGDVEEERRRAALVLGRLRREFQRFFDLSPILWEYEPLLASGHFQDCVEEPSAVSIVVVILWSRLGTPLPERTAKREYRGTDGRVPVTGTEWEFEEALRHHEQTRAASSDGLGTPELLVYRKDIPGEVRGRSAAEMERAVAQMRALEGFWERYFETREGQFVAAHYRFASLGQFETLLEKHLRSLLTARINRRPGELAAPVSWAGCPFRGLQSFEVEHAPVFFGRDRAVRQVTEALARRAAAGTAFVLVLGASGCGKSSLVKAGVVPNLSQPGVVSGVDAWRRCVFRPGGEAAGGDLFDRLAAALAEPGCLPELVAGLTRAEVADQFRRGEGAETVKLALMLASGQPRPPDAPPRVVRLILVVDQLEELFTGVASPEEQEAFAQILRRLAGSSAVWVAASMRSDFFHRLAEVPTLHGIAVGEGLYHLAAPRAEEIEQMIRLPAETAGLAFEKDEDGVGLDTMLREAAARSPDALPLLEFALEQLYRTDVEAAAGRVLRLATYNGLGRLEGAIAAQAESAVEAMPDDARVALPSVLLAMLSLGEGDEVVTARPAVRAGLDADPAKAATLEGLVVARLVVSRRLADGTVVVALAHEALLQHWPRLRDIVREHRDFLRARGNVTAEAALWQREGEDPSRLLAEGNPLAEGTQLLQRRDELEPEVIRFVEVSAETARKRREAETDRQRGNIRRTRIALAVVALLAVAAAIGAWFGFAGQRAASLSASVARQSAAEASRNAAEASRNAAEASRNAAEATRQLAQAQVRESRFLTEKARAAEAQQKYEAAMAIALAALPTNLDHPNRPLVPEVLSELSRIVAKDRLKAVLAGHTAAVLSAAFSPSGDRIVTASADGTARLWDARTGAEIALLKHDDRVNSAVFSASGDRIVTASDDGTARVWNALSGALIAALKHDDAVLSAAFSPSADRIVTASADSTARLWDARTGAQIAVLKHEDIVRSAVFSSLGDRIVTASNDNSARLWDARTGAQIALLKHDGAVNSAVFSPSGDRIVTASYDTTARLWDARTGAQLAVLHHDHTVRSAVFSPSGDRIVTASDDFTARLWDAHTGAQYFVLRHDREVRFATFSPSGDLILTTSVGLTLNTPEDNAARLWDARTSAQIAVLRCDAEILSAAFNPSGDRIVTSSQDGTVRLWDVGDRAEMAILKHDGMVNSAAFSPSGDRIVTASNDRTARLWDARTGRQIAVFKHDDSVHFAAFSPSGDRIVTASFDHTVRLWDARTGAQIVVLNHYRPALFAVFSQLGDRIVTTSADNTARLWDARTGAQVAVLKHYDWVGFAAFSPSGDRIVTAAADETARLWDGRTGAPIAVFHHGGVVFTATFSPSGDRVLTASFDHTARLWDARTGAQIAVFQHEGAVYFAAFSPSGDRILTASYDNTARLWDARTGAQILVLQHDGAVNSAAFSPSGDRIVTASADKTARVWDARTGAEIAVIEHKGLVVSAVFSPSGNKVVTASADGTTRLWHAPPPAEILLAYARLASLQRLGANERRALYLDPLETHGGAAAAAGEGKRQQELAQRLERGDGVEMDLKKALLHHALAARLFEEAGDEAGANFEITRRGSIARTLSYSEVAKVWEEVEAWKPSNTPATP